MFPSLSAKIPSMADAKFSPSVTTPYQEERKNLIAYTRNGEKDLLILGNMQAQSQKVSLSGEMKKVLLNNQETAEITGKEIILKPYQFIVLEIAD